MNAAIEKPKSVKIAIRLAWVGLSLSILYGILYFSYLQKFDTNFLKWSLFEQAPTLNMLVSLASFVLLLTLLAIFLIFNISRQRNWARLTYIIYSLIALIGLPSGIMDEIQLFSAIPSDAIGIIAKILQLTSFTLSILFNLAACALLLSKQANAWFKEYTDNENIYEIFIRSDKWLTSFLCGHVLLTALTWQKSISIAYPILGNILNVFYTASFFLNLTLFIRWIYTANLTAQELAPTKMRFGKWCALWFFVPIFQFWKPYQAIKEICQIANNPTEWREQKAPDILKIWWLFVVTAPLIAFCTNFKIAQVVLIFFFFFLARQIRQSFKESFTLTKFSISPQKPA